MPSLIKNETAEAMTIAFSAGTFSLLLRVSEVTSQGWIALLNDLLRNPANIGRANGILVTGGNLVGVAAPIVTGYVVAGTGNYDYAFLVAGALLLVGASACLVFTRDPIVPEVDSGKTELAYKGAQ